jgi:hypothetical protein
VAALHYEFAAAWQGATASAQGERRALRFRGLRSGQAERRGEAADKLENSATMKLTVAVHVEGS